MEKPRHALLPFVLLLVGAAAAPAFAQAERRPGAESPRFIDRQSFAVEREELAPVMAADGSNLLARM